MAALGLVLAAWVTLSLPVGICVGRFLRVRSVPA